MLSLYQPSANTEAYLNSFGTKGLADKYNYITLKGAFQLYTLQTSFAVNAQMALQQREAQTTITFGIDLEKTADKLQVRVNTSDKL